jgi:hypothetical protein
MVRGMAQLVEHLTSKYEALSSSSGTSKNNNNKIKLVALQLEYSSEPFAKLIRLTLLGSIIRGSDSVDLSLGLRVYF